MISSNTSNPLKTVPREKAFYFFISIGNYVGVSASSLKEFAERTADVDGKSLEFHLYRGDFDKWISEVLQDEKLAIEIRRLAKLNLTGDSIRNQLVAIVSARLQELAQPNVEVEPSRASPLYARFEGISQHEP